MYASLLDRKIEYWKHQLLDLGKRNKMINYRETKRSTLKLVEPSFDELYQRLAINEETLTFQRAVDRETDIRVFSILSLLESLSSPLPVTIGDIKTEGSILERQKTLKNIRSKARLSLEEQGTNILYLSFGFIEWRDGKGASAQWIKSPLILVPAVLTLEALNSPYTLSKHEDDIVINPTLQYYLKTEYGIELPNFDSDKDTLNSYLENIEGIADQRGWRILKEVSLGLLSFLKISMYNDLIRNEERIKSNPVIRAMSGDAEEVNRIPEKLRTFDLDSIKTQDCYQVMSADSSQQEAILYSKNSISFVMQGPPGTGKSQTITNIIAEALADGKKVLFVSEKMAALQVVYLRLQDAHLADFCLPLHSYKANKKEILEQIGANLKLKQTRVKDTALHDLEELLTIRQELNQYASELHQLNPELNISCYEVYGKLEAVNNAPSLTFAMESPLGVTQARLQLYLNKIKEYSLSLQRIGYQIHDHPWEGLQTRTIGYEYSEKMRHELTSLQEKLDAIVGHVAQIKECPELQTVLTYDQLPTLVDSIHLIHELPEIPENWSDKGNLALLLVEAEKAKAQYEQLFSLEREIADTFCVDIFDFDYNGWKNKLLAAANGFVELSLIKEITPYYFIDNAKPLQIAFSSVYTGLIQASTAFASIHSLLGVELDVNEVHLQHLSQLLTLIQKNEMILKQWFDEDLPGIRAFVEEAKDRALHLLQTKNQILANWEADILTLDYSPMLLRYKTEYLNIFKVFNAQYRNDRKQLLALSKMVRKKMPDDVAINLLVALKDYHEQNEWFESKKAELSDVLLSYYNDVETKWDDVLSALNTAEKLKAFPSIYLSDTLMDAVSKDHAELTASLRALLKEATAAFSRIHEAIAVSTIEMGIDSRNFNGVAAAAIVETYLARLAFVREQTARLAPYLHSEDTSIEVICQAIERLNAHRALSISLSENAEALKRHFGIHFSDRLTKWDEVISLLNKVRNIEQRQISDDFNAIVLAGASRKRELQETATEIARMYSMAKSSFEWIASQFDPSCFSATARVNALAKKTEMCIASLSTLDDWIDYQEAKEDCCKNGLADFIEKIEAAALFTDIERIFLKGFYRTWLDAVCDKSASVRRFKRNTHDERIQKFIKLDDLQLLIAQMRIREKLIENLPSNHQLLRATDEVAILQKELNKKRNIMPLRRLFKLIPNLLMKLKPCLMMSPLSVSYFLETEAYA